MKILRSLSVGLVLGLFVGVAPSCQPQKAQCLASNCPGCCDSTGTCQQVINATHCGAAGGTCTSCLNGQVCNQGVCVAGPRDGGTCSSATCPHGCCDHTGVCQGGGVPAACGSGGGACVTCGSGQSCNALGQCQGGAGCAVCFQGTTCETTSNNLHCGADGGPCTTCLTGFSCTGGVCRSVGDAGVCGPTNCTGCCNSGVCIPVANESNTKCGSGGQACATCPSGDSCQSGSCAATPDGGCGPSNCTGCCTASGCLTVPNETNTKCGVQGALCLPCANGGTCNAGVCTGGTDGGPTDAGPSCGPRNCNGCCDSTGACQTGTTTAACGQTGVACTACIGSQICSNGVCVVDAGIPCGPSNCTGCCDSTGTCQPGSAPGACGTAGATCTNCPTGDTCASGVCKPPTSACSPACLAYQCCDSSGVCQNSVNTTCGGGSAACVDCTANGQDCGWNSYVCAAPGTNPIGSACASDAVCVPETNSGGGPDCNSSWPGGYCTEPCPTSRTSNQCTDPNGICAKTGNGYLCLAGCLTDSDCGRGTQYYCEPTFGYCVPSCTTNADCQNFWGDPSGFCSAGQCCGANIPGVGC